jgi:transcriptional regulator with XRE-family HTH domain
LARERRQVPEAASPTVRRRRLAAELRRLRERAGLTGDQVAKRMGWSTSKLSRIENAHTTPDPSEVQKLILLYGVEESYAGQLSTLAEEAARKGWWEAYGDVLPDTYAALIGLEEEATAAFGWMPDVVPGLLQTEDYAREVIRTHMSSTRTIPPGEIERGVQARITRQQILKRNPPFDLNMVICESVLLRRIGSNPVMKLQLDHLLDVTQYSSISLRVLPLNASHPIGTGAFVLLKYNRVHDIAYHDIVYLEHLAGAMYLEDERDTFQYLTAFENLFDSALDASASRNIIAEKRKNWG